MTMRRNYWLYSAGLVVAWAIVLVISSAAGDVHKVLPVCGGFVIGWVSTTIARYVYPPPRRWLRAESGQ